MFQKIKYFEGRTQKVYKIKVERLTSQAWKPAQIIEVVHEHGCAWSQKPSWVNQLRYEASTRQGHAKGRQHYRRNQLTLPAKCSAIRIIKWYEFRWEFIVVENEALVCQQR